MTAYLDFSSYFKGVDSEIEAQAKRNKKDQDKLLFDTLFPSISEQQIASAKALTSKSTYDLAKTEEERQRYLAAFERRNTETEASEADKLYKAKLGLGQTGVANDNFTRTLDVYKNDFVNKIGRQDVNNQIAAGSVAADLTRIPQIVETEAKASVLRDTNKAIEVENGLNNIQSVPELERQAIMNRNFGNPVGMLKEFSERLNWRVSADNKNAVINGITVPLEDVELYLQSPAKYRTSKNEAANKIAIKEAGLADDSKATTKPPTPSAIVVNKIGTNPQATPNAQPQTPANPAKVAEIVKAAGQPATPTDPNTAAKAAVGLTAPVTNNIEQLKIDAQVLQKEVLEIQKDAEVYSRPENRLKVTPEMRARLQEKLSDKNNLLYIKNQEIEKIIKNASDAERKARQDAVLNRNNSQLSDIAKKY